MTLALSLAMKRCLALLLLATLPAQGLAALVTHTFAGDNGTAPKITPHTLPITTRQTAAFLPALATAVLG
jgi:hypothetical protein